MKHEKQFVRQLQSGDTRAFTRFVDEYGKRVHALARRYARNETEAEDLTQEIFVELFRALPQFRGDAALSTWLYRIALNRCLRYQSRRQPDTVTLDDLPLTGDAPSPDEHTLQTELRSHVNDALQTLSPGHREAVILHELHGLTYAECAAILNVPVGTVKSRLFHAFGRLRERLSGYVKGEDTTAVRSANPDVSTVARAVPVYSENC